MVKWNNSCVSSCTSYYKTIHRILLFHTFLYTLSIIDCLSVFFLKPLETTVIRVGEDQTCENPAFPILYTLLSMIGVRFLDQGTTITKLGNTGH